MARSLRTWTAPNLAALLSSWKLSRQIALDDRELQRRRRHYLFWCADEDRAPRPNRRAEAEFVTALLGSKPPRSTSSSYRSWPTSSSPPLINPCAGREIRDRRDEALVRLMTETTRAREAVGIQLPDLDLTRGLVTVVRDMRGRSRIVPFGASTTRALDRYVHAGRSHRLAETKALF